MLSLVSVEVDFGTRILFKNVSFLLQRGDRVALSVETVLVSRRC